MSAQHCTSPSGCDRRATTAVHHIGPWVAVRPDHLSDGWVHEWRCDDHAVEEVLMAIHHEEIIQGYLMQEEGVGT